MPYTLTKETSDSVTVPAVVVSHDPESRIYCRDRPELQQTKL